MRVAGTAGVFEGADFQPGDFDLVYANSAAALLAAFWKAGKGTRHLWTDMFTRKEVFSWMNPLLRRRWPGDIEYLKDLMLQEFTRSDFKALDAPSPEIRVGILNLRSGKTEYVTLTSINAIRLLSASCALPVVAPAVKFGEDMYVDGGTLYPIPMIRAWEENHWLEEDLEFLFISNRPGNWEHPEVNRLLAWWTFPSSPKLRRSLLRRPAHHWAATALMESLAEKKTNGILMRRFHPPKPYGIDLLERDPVKVEGVYEEGRVLGKLNFNTGASAMTG